MSQHGSEALKDRLDVYRALLRRDDAAEIPELERLVSMLESELRGGREPAEDVGRRRR
jgi:hypothetical protein